MGKIISVVNRKGGVGKTTLSIAIADAFVTELKANVSIVDLDPQASATRALLTEKEFSESVENQENLVALMNDCLRGLVPDLLKYRIGMVHPYTNSADTNLSLYPNSDEFWNLEADQIERDGAIKLQEQLLSILQKIADKCGDDYIVIDCPPGQSFGSLAALMASNLIICPVTTDKMALWGKDLLFKYIKRHTPDRHIKFIASRVRTNINAGLAAYEVLQNSENMLIVEGGETGDGGTTQIGKFSDTASVHNRIGFTPRNSLQAVYGAKGANELRLIVNAIRREVENG